MPRFQDALKVLLSVAIVGNLALAAEPPTMLKANTKTSTGIIDLSLTSTGELLGRYIDGEGRGVAGAIVTVAQEGEFVARTSTDETGAYRLSGLRSGVYQLRVGNQIHLIRIWSPDIAPAAAKPLLTTVQNDQVIRGQFGGGGGFDWGVAFGIAGLAVGTVAIIEAEEAKDEAGEVRKEMESLDGLGAPVSP